MEHYIFYCKLSLLAVLSLITACCMLSRRWYVNLAAFLACLSGETFLAHLFFPGYMLCPAAASFIILFLSRIWDLSRTPAKGNGADPIRLPVRSGIRESRLEFHYHYSNFLVYGGAGSGKTKSIGKWLLSEYMRLGFAGFIYDFKDTDYTRTAYNLIKRHRYPHKFYYVSFDRPERSYRFNPLKVVRDRTELIQLMEDVLLALLPKKEQQNEWVAGGLTGLYNERYFDALLKENELNRTPFVLFYLDLDRFKPVNDRYGHDVGDQLLKEVASRLRGCVRESDAVFRIGGDEFALIVNGAITEGFCKSRVEKIKAAIREPYRLKDAEVQVGTSCGCAVYPCDSDDVRAIRILADHRMYEDKQRSGRS